ncbi:MAG: DUF1287 domain-containing protein [Deltaproteobacteria bacterium]|nr:DUF1287 domain-containing protein [Deltaproteobacteria bacterium]
MKRTYLFLLFLLLAPLSLQANPLTKDFVAAAKERTKQQVTYDSSYYTIDYPNGDIPGHLGVCTDVVIRSYRQVGIDLQKKVHEDIKKNFSLYPSKKLWGLKGVDSNIDHRRVPNLQTFFKRQGQSLKISKDPQDYRAGDLVTWMLPGNLPHIGIVVDQKTSKGERPFIVHNIGAGPKMEDVLFDYPITGHYRYGLKD